MQENLEVNFSSKLMYHYNDVSSINDILVFKGLRAINLSGIYIENYLNIINKSKFYINIDIPYALNNTLARRDLIKSYNSQLKNNKLFNGFNISPLGSTLFNTDWIDFTKDLKILNNEVNNKELRVLLNLSNIEYDDDVIKISNICEQENIKTIILGSSNYNLRVFDNIINMTKIIKENTSLKVGMFGGFNNTDLINKMHHHNVSPILVNPLNILSLFK